MRRFLARLAASAAILGLSLAGLPAQAQLSLAVPVHPTSPAASPPSAAAAAPLKAPLPGAGKFSEDPHFFAELPFGEESNPQPGNQPLRFTGKERDTETEFDYFGARYYQARWGRFTTVDPVVDIKDALFIPQKWNRYAYARNNPLKFVDPDGRVERTTLDARLLAESRAKAGYKNEPGGPFETALMGAGVGLALAPVAMLGVEFAPAFWMEAQIAGGTCTASPGCRGAIQDIAEGFSGAPPGSLGSTASNAANALRLRKQLASEAQLAELLSGGGEVMAGAGHKVAIRDVERLVSTYGGEASDWAKIRSSHFKAAEGVGFETHAYRNVKTGEVFEPKTKFQ